MSIGRFWFYVVTVCLAIAATPLAADWTHYAGNPQRNSVGSEPAGIDLSAPGAIMTPTGGALVGCASPMVYGGRVYAHGVRSSDGANAIYAFDAGTGAQLWAAPVGMDWWDSWASPAVDAASGSVLLAAGNTMMAVDAVTGANKWVSGPTFNNDVVNSSPLVIGGYAYVTDSGWSNSFQSYVYAVDMTDGSIAWSQPIGTQTGTTVAASPDGSTVYVADTDDSFSGRIRGFNAVTGTPGLNQQVDTTGGGFWGGLTVTADAIYAQSYTFANDTSAVLYKVNRTTGATIWSQPCIRGDTMPVVADGKVFVSGGYDGNYVQAFLDDATGTPLWTYDQAGGWTQQLLYADGLLYVGVGETGWSFDPASELQVLDTSLDPQMPGFLVDSYLNTGSSPALGSDLYTIGDAGIYRFGVLPEPGTAILLGVGAGVLLLRRRRAQSRRG
ncbi:MAG TPA: PQQ-binding-like beta-propeller repeat protein [Candidatus Brocadiia bacterium]|nr:PQQ-binding-like beta-propeller repeat protein [Candidatus Brocadiia bacterium]